MPKKTIVEKFKEFILQVQKVLKKVQEMMKFKKVQKFEHHRQSEFLEIISEDNVIVNIDSSSTRHRSQRALTIFLTTEHVLAALFFDYNLILLLLPNNYMYFIYIQLFNNNNNMRISVPE